MRYSTPCHSETTSERRSFSLVASASRTKPTDSKWKPRPELPSRAAILQGVGVGKDQQRMFWVGIGKCLRRRPLADGTDLFWIHRHGLAQGLPSPSTAHEDGI